MLKGRQDTLTAEIEAIRKRLAVPPVELDEVEIKQPGEDLRAAAPALRASRTAAAAHRATDDRRERAIEEPAAEAAARRAGEQS